MLESGRVQATIQNVHIVVNLFQRVQFIGIGVSQALTLTHLYIVQNNAVLRHMDRAARTLQARREEIRQAVQVAMH